MRFILFTLCIFLFSALRVSAAFESRELDLDNTNEFASRDFDLKERNVFNSRGNSPYDRSWAFKREEPFSLEIRDHGTSEQVTVRQNPIVKAWRTVKQKIWDWRNRDLLRQQAQYYSRPRRALN
ncbi:hypothetical protein CC1G_08449 [Coprinopsis cinerea okayama7|uniref:Secreted RxLR effector peptide protein n=1 Tax=Coprinopsis cinerea (strain Okayama-7 / 130 / ATCC MYA-4618 / FGSC 9003) TaxID=240176 RepID=A8NLY8_COPC7|nr:hypothetical protein CC1G_08449 [Coprinopsis cinerea okayama7\|eukprot:XP_001834804.1 hypothetical protein CC1G_08449 [Coprinopsis cinerea okayama7\